jgi:hypothetical protein
MKSLGDVKPDRFGLFKSQIQDLLQTTIEQVQRHGDNIIELTIRAPLAAQQYKPGQFFRLQNFETYADKGYKPRTSCTATITAPNNYFILSDEVSSSTDASTHKDPAIYNSTAYNHTVIKKSSVLKKIVLQSASVTARCSRGGGWRTFKTCYAIAEIKAKAYPHKCLKEQIRKIFGGLF